MTTKPPTTDAPTVDDGWDDGPENNGAPTDGATADDGTPRRRKRRRRRRDPGSVAPTPPVASGASPNAAPNPSGPTSADARPPRPPRAESGGRPDAAKRERRDDAKGQPRGTQPPRERGNVTQARVKPRDDRPRDGGGRAQPQATFGPQGSTMGGASNPSIKLAELAATGKLEPTPRTAMPSRAPYARAPGMTKGPAYGDDNDAPADTSIPWGQEDDTPATPVTLTSLLPEEPAASIWHTGPSTQLYPVANLAGVRYSRTGRVVWVVLGNQEAKLGDRLVVDHERGPRIGEVVQAPVLRSLRDRNLRRVLRQAGPEDDLRARQADVDAAQALRVAKDKVAQLGLPLKITRADYPAGAGRGAKLFIYYTTDDRVDVRALLRDLTNQTGARIELRQLGVRDEAKHVGGIGSCGMTLCCTTWLPDFVPVSIKMAKDQGLVLNPTKVSGQCGRLKCCLVYEQEGYAELRKGLPKLGKRVVSARGEGRVVEVDVLRRRIRVSYGPGESELLGAEDIRPLFPSGQGNPSGSRKGGDDKAAPSDARADADDDDDAAPPEGTPLS